MREAARDTSFARLMEGWRSLAIVLAIPLLLALWMLPPLFNTWPYRKRRGLTAGSMLWAEALHAEVRYFHHSEGRYPADLAEVKASLGIQSPDDRRLRFFRDSWGRDLRYVVDAPRLNVGSFDIHSVGKNGRDEYHRPDFGDDILVAADGHAYAPHEAANPPPREHLLEWSFPPARDVVEPEEH